MSLLFRHRNLGIEVTFRVDPPELEALAGDLHSCSIVGQSRVGLDTAADLAWAHCEDHSWQILLKGEPWEAPIHREDDLFLLSDSLLDDLARERLSAYPLLHASAVVDSRDHRATVICGTSGTGKTSLALAAILGGWGWLSDELLCFRQADPLVAEGFRRNFNLKEHSFGQFPETAHLEGARECVVALTQRKVRFFDPDRLPLVGGLDKAARGDAERLIAAASQRPATGRGRGQVPSATVRAMVFPEYVEGVPPEAVPLSGPEVVAKLLPELRGAQKEGVAWMAHAARQLPAFHLPYSNPREAFACLAQLLP